MSKPTLAIYGIKDRNVAPFPMFVHDHNLCVMQDGRILGYLHLERLSRRKYDNRLDLFIEDLLDSNMLNLPVKLDEFDIVSVNDFVGNAFISQNGRLHIEANHQLVLEPRLFAASAYLMQRSSWCGKEIPAWCCPHEIAHIFSCVPFYGSFKENSLLISFDGASSLGNYSAFIYRNGTISLIENNWSDLGFASKLFNDNKLSFCMLGVPPYAHCSLPGKLMGYASWGRYHRGIEAWLRENAFFNCCGQFDDKQILDSIKRRFGSVCDEFCTHYDFLKDCAATIQWVFTDAFMRKLYNLQQKYNCVYLYYGGGCALNIVTNSKIVESGLFKEVFIPPCCNDSGLSIGAASALEIQKGNKLHCHNPYLCNIGLGSVDFDVCDEEIRAVANMLIHKKIIGICNGTAEIGPRALGNRSIICLADSKNLAVELSMGMKKREWYRPIAPIMLLKNAKLVTEQRISILSRFMLQDYIIKSDFRDKLSGVVHINNTARIQTLSTESENPFMFKLLTYLHERFNVLALINTSFNEAGEAIVHTAEQARLAARRMNLDGVVINGHLEVL